MTEEVSVSGPAFDGPDAMLSALMRQSRDALAGQASADWHQNLNERLKHPTPYYETQLNTQNLTDSSARVNDRKIIYGPWLEGLGSRNYPRTVFRGYRSMRDAAQSSGRKAKDLVQPLVDRFIDRMNGK